MTAREIVASLGGQWHGRYGTAKCPAHDDRSPSLSISDGHHRVLVRCHAGCDQAKVIAALRSRGLWGGSEDRSIDPSSPTAEERQRREVERATDRKRRTGLALRIWREAQPAAGSPVELYLRSRGISIAPPPSLRYHPALLHQPTGLHLPAMVAAVQAPTREIVAVHRTFLTDSGRKAPVNSPKMMIGPCAGGAVRFASAGPTLAIGEGIETCLAAMQATGLGTWAALSTSGLRGLVLPEQVDEVIILADGDAPGEEAALAAAARWEREARAVRIARPPRGADFNDALRGAA